MGTLVSLLLVALAVVAVGLVIWAILDKLSKWKLEFGIRVDDVLNVYESKHLTFEGCKRSAARLKVRYGDLFAGAVAVAPDGTRTQL